VSGATQMGKVLLTAQHRFALQLCVVSAAAAFMGGCSSDATRLGDPFGNPFATASADSAKTHRHVASASDVVPAGRMPPVTSTALAPRPVAVASLSSTRPVASASREPVSTETTGSIDRSATRTASSASFGGWSSAGGTAIQVADGDTTEILSKRYGVPATALLQVNGLHSAADIRPGTRLIIPIYSASAQQPAHMAEAAPRIVPEPHPTAQPRTETKRAIAAAPAHAVKQQVAQVQAAEKTPKHGTSTVKDVTGKKPVVTASLAPKPLGKLPVPAKTVVTKAVAPVVAKAEPAPAPQTLAPKPVKTAAVAATGTTVVPQAAAPAAAAPAAAAPAAVADNSPEFRWPARGRIIQGFKSGSGGNDGINIAVPEGTAVKAAEGGVVAYAGSELKGYGNLVLIRHPNGFVSAYANNGEIDVKRGETVKRGQMIAKSGQSGNVSSPQLHFELRKGSTPVDPTQYLAGL
jgi:murein DD-endopeptidase MepM/ murein hydrolase activator NlpD